MEKPKSEREHFRGALKWAVIVWGSVWLYHYWLRGLPSNLAVVIAESVLVVGSLAIPTAFLFWVFPAIGRWRTQREDRAAAKRER